MKTLIPLSCALALIICQLMVNAEGLYKWVDSKGNTQYGDKPPANVNAKIIDLPKITIIDNYAEQWKPIKFEDADPIKQSKPQQTQSNPSAYSKLTFLAPKPNQSIRANDGDVSAMISIKPPLKKGHKIVFSIDGKSAEKGTSRTKNFSNLNRGNHTIGVKVIDAKGKTLKSSSVGFNVLRLSALRNNQTNQATKAQQTRSFQSARQQQIQNGN